MRRILRFIILVPLLTLVILDFVVSLVIIRDVHDVGVGVFVALPGYVVLTVAFYVYIKSRPEIWSYMKTSGKIAVPVYVVLSVGPLAYLFYGFSSGILTIETATLPLLVPFFAGPLTVWVVYLSRKSM